MSKGLSRGDNLVDARGVKISPGDAVIYGFGVGRSVAMAEGKIRDDGYGHVSTTPSGRVWVTIVRRSYGGGEEERVHIAPDRLVVLKNIEYRVPGFYGDPETGAFLPPSPLPTQDEANYAQLVELIERNVDDLQALLAGGPPPDWLFSDYRARALGRTPTDEEARTDGITTYRRWITERRDQLARIEERLPCCAHAGTEGRVEPHCACPCHMTAEELYL